MQEKPFYACTLASRIKEIRVAELQGPLDLYWQVQAETINAAFEYMPVDVIATKCKQTKWTGITVEVFPASQCSIVRKTEEIALVNESYS